ncbi:MAG: hypothetical protein IT445_02885 [Phycisphaeraceae bacterium]|nr:hypothetical protein [Phycisphaeraceae bacterium]
MRALLGGRLYRSHELTYTGELIDCGHCSPITGEAIVKKTTGKQYIYYRCSMIVFELSQSLRKKWLASDCIAKRQILEMICLNFSLDGVTLVSTMKKPFELLIEGLCVPSSRGDWTAIELFVMEVMREIATSHRQPFNNGSAVSISVGDFGCMATGWDV